MVGITLILTLLAAEADARRQIPKLGHPSFHVREAAHRKLAQGMPVGRGSLKLATKDHDAEIARRAELIGRAWEREFHLVMPTTYPHLPWIDSLSQPRLHLDKTFAVVEPPDLLGKHDAAALCSYYLWDAGHLEQSYVPPDWCEFRRATELYVRDLRDAGVSKARIRRMLDEMALIETYWYDKGHGGVPR